jgi:hypothetical protein
MYSPFTAVFIDIVYFKQYCTAENYFKRKVNRNGVRHDGAVFMIFRYDYFEMTLQLHSAALLHQRKCSRFCAGQKTEQAQEVAQLATLQLNMIGYHTDRYFFDILVRTPPLL